MDEVPSKHLPSRSIQPTPSTKRRPPRERRVVDLNVSHSQEPVATTVCDEARHSYECTTKKCGNSRKGTTAD